MLDYFIVFVLGWMFGVCTVIFAWILFTFDYDAVNYKSFQEYLCTPSSGKLELNWTTRQVLALFSKGASKRWYEARAHLGRGVFVSLLAAFHLVYVIRIEYETDKDSVLCYSTKIIHGFQSLNDIMKKLPVLSNTMRHEKATCYYQTFVSGHNIVHDFMTI